MAHNTGSDPMVVNLDRLARHDRLRAGSKAVNLGALIRAGFPVPPGYCVTTAAYRQWIGGCPAAGAILARLEAMDAEQPQQALSLAAQLRQQLDATPIPDPLADTITAPWQQAGPGQAWAVRSSATAEDSPDASFAGQHESLLNVRGRPALLDALRRCWSSLFADRAVLYRMRNRIPHQTAAMAVVIQEMVAAQTAGVLFTADPLTGDPSRLVIEAAWGLGETLVAGQVNPDRLVLDKHTLRILERHTNRKLTETVPDEGGVGIRHRPLDQSRQNQPCLDDAMARRLAELAGQAERLFHGPQDIEWAVCNGHIFLLQSRPITVRPGPVAPEVWSSANICENFPGVVTPMTWSVVQELLEECFKPLLHPLGINLRHRPWFNLIAGRLYLNLTISGQLLHQIHASRYANLWELFGGPQAATQAALLPSQSTAPPPLTFRQHLFLAAFTVCALAGAIQRSDRAFLSLLRQRMDALDQLDLKALPDDDLAQFTPNIRFRIFPELASPWTVARAVGPMIVGLSSSAALPRLSRRWLSDADGSIAARLLSGAGGMESAETAPDLWRLAAVARQDPAVARLLQQEKNFASTRQDLEQLPAGRQFLEHWQRFMARHGHHTRGELDIHNPRWSETPDYVLHIVRGYLGMAEKDDPLAQQARRLRQRDQLLHDCQSRLRYPIRRWLFRFLIRHAQHGLVSRENVKSQAIRAVGAIRRALLEAGQRLARRGFLPEPADIFFLRLEEVGPALAGKLAADMAGILDARKAESARNQQLTPPIVVVGRFDPDRMPLEAAPGQVTRLEGLPVSPGVAIGRARVLLHTDAQSRVLPGEILVAPFTDPGWTPYFLPAAGIVMDIGGQLSHGSIVAREYGLPAVVNVGHATQIIRTGQLIEVDGNRGVVTILPSVQG